MSVTQQDLIDDVRRELHSWPTVGAKLSSLVLITGNTLTLQESFFRDFCVPGGLIEIGNEVMLIVNLPKDTSSILVLRGYMGTTAAAHSTVDDVLIHNKGHWSNHEIKRFINDAIAWLHPHSWTQGTSDTFTINANAFDAALPSGTGISSPAGNQICRLQYRDSASRWHSIYGWEFIGGRIRIKSTPGGLTTFRLLYLLFEDALTSLTDALANELFREAIYKYAASLAFDGLKNNRARYLDYAASLNDRASTPDELTRVVYDIRNKANLARDEHSMPTPAGFISTFEEP
ncbi:MAG: hypothetical protein ABIH23_01330 [bacterium]